MEILAHYKPTGLIGKPRIFRCVYCGYILKADFTEYEDAGNNITGLKRCRCPGCNRWCRQLVTVKRSGYEKDLEDNHFEPTVVAPDLDDLLKLNDEQYRVKHKDDRIIQ